MSPKTRGYITESASSSWLLQAMWTIGNPVNDELKNIAQVEHSRHRCFDNFIVNKLGAIAAYCMFPKKPCINVQRTLDTQLTLFWIHRHLHWKKKECAFLSNRTPRVRHGGPEGCEALDPRGTVNYASITCHHCDKMMTRIHRIHVNLYDFPLVSRGF